MAMADDYDAALFAVLDDPDYYISDDEWYGLLQDPGTDMNDEQKKKWSKSPKSRKARHIASDQRLFRDIYALAEKMYDILEEKRDVFRKLQKNRLNAIHPIGAIITQRRINYCRGDLHSVTDLCKQRQNERQDQYLPLKPT